MDELTALGIARHFWPGPVALLVAAALYFAPQYSAAVITHAANERAQQLTSLLKDALKSSLADSRQYHPKRPAR